ncbi:uncharacterized protein avpi1 [Corythoichthys intestinalis]|uniref:uncharacterized protein avpi1 n=1 Tax=Corythoichthys intestinalis TaxID=161448 RepID=UPI0025A52860|nr:uncharacterized protein avpi1 [Corythoichthys intestinalis]XP_057703471.1 uncharacterized protein avpi1 [Corythoichthys intestinalis]XP_057703472.1 uncharacterized protein avpi1 [Corythoichthys intestinalis]
METETASPTPSVVTGPSTLWRLAGQRARKHGSGNIFSNVKLWQLQRLFRAAGDKDAEQRAQLVWAHRDEAELAQALVGLRTRSHRRGLRTKGRDVLGTHWLRAFNHLRIGEGYPISQEKESGDETDFENAAHSRKDPQQNTTTEPTGGSAEASAVLTESQMASWSTDREPRAGSGARRRGERNSERYLHRIQH